MKFSQIHTGANHSIAIAVNNAVYAWGRNESGQLGDGTFEARTTPVRVLVPAGVTFTQVSIGDAHSLGLAEDGSAYVWGENSFGDLGDGTTVNQSAPVRVLVPAGVTLTQLSSGAWHSTALAEDGSAYAWGPNFDGLLGDGTRTGRSVPVPVQMPAGTTFTQVNAGRTHSLALTVDGAAYAWGDNRYGQLGDGTTSVRLAPVLVPMRVTVTDVTFGGRSATHLVGNPDGSWTVKTPPHPAGAVDVVMSWTLNGVAQPDLTYVDGFTFAAPGVAPSVTDPADQVVAAGKDAVFAVEVSGTPAPAISWEISADEGATWNAVTAADGAVSDDGKTMTVVATEALSGSQYRAIAANSAGTVTSSAALLTVSAVPVTPVAPVAPSVTDPADQVVPGDGGGSAHALARTGSHAAAPIAVGVLVLLAGFGLVLTSRRKRV